ncbi:nucleotidyltransferase family protein [Picrophilus oshimae]|uniref:Nucleotidyl transferase n=1 Tax=Picrophilus torridus (strain ATCC 700027 / DSM 9790 / JCM 10055 / NBRC 100828 / KAW 2/3) TaxID=1122961 RepID=Q6L2J3_PICTO|nr:nucleotidyltransferase family protein [Picrophilus oshimae]AAT42809.1 sugar phosphate nucleotydyl transferase [Picrophilus oshimae DSM 9789]SMD31570.1 Nucleotidyl transferase [Picrophilus oshimae DSM 9789]
MIGAILAGGYGKRLKPLTDKLPKSLVEIKPGYTIMDRQLFDFKVMGISDIYILSGHLGEKIEERYGNHYNGLNLYYLKEEKPLGTLYSLRNLANEVTDDIVLRNGDIVTDINFKEFVNFSLHNNYGMTMFVTEMRSPYGIVDTLLDKVINFKEKPYLNYYINAGIYLIKENIIDYFYKDYNGKDIEVTIFPELARQGLIGAYKEKAFWVGVDSEKDLETLRLEYINREDREWGYIKCIFEDDKKLVHEYFIKAGETVNVSEPYALIRFIDGRGTINDRSEFYTSDYALEIKSSSRISAIENTRLEVIKIKA